MGFSPPGCRRSRAGTEGARVYLTGRHKSELDAAAEVLGDRAIAIQNDVSDLDDLDSLFRRIADDGNRLDVLFANAGGGEVQVYP